jgi:hypothetical protein
MFKAEGPDLASGMTFYLGPDAALATPEHPSGHREFRHHDTITDDQYAAATPETQRLIDGLVERGALVKTKTKAATAVEKE